MSQQVCDRLTRFVRCVGQLCIFNDNSDKKRTATSTLMFSPNPRNLVWRDLNIFSIVNHVIFYEGSLPIFFDGSPSLMPFRFAFAMFEVLTHLIETGEKEFNCEEYQSHTKSVFPSGLRFIQRAISSPQFWISAPTAFEPTSDVQMNSELTGTCLVESSKNRRYSRFIAN